MTFYHDQCFIVLAREPKHLIDIHGVKCSHISEDTTNFVPSREMRQTTADALPGLVCLLWYSGVSQTNSCVEVCCGVFDLMLINWTFCLLKVFGDIL